MPDKAHAEVDEKIKRIEYWISLVYAASLKKAKKLVKEYCDSLSEEDTKKRKALEKEKISERQYITWLKRRVLMNYDFTDLKEKISRQVMETNRRAIDYINGQMEDIYKTTNNAVTGDFIDGGLNVQSFVVDEFTNDIVPMKKLDEKKDIDWNKKKISSAVLAFLLIEESLDGVNKAVSSVFKANSESMVRNARTMATAAENKARQDLFEQMTESGVSLEKEWVAINDERTRHSHAELDGVSVAVNDVFINSDGPIRYPGDPEATPANTYNCRCHIVARINWQDSGQT